MSARGDLYVLLIGINDYECEAVRKLHFAVADVRSFQEFLEERMHLDSRNCIMLSHPLEGSGKAPRPPKSSAPWPSSLRHPSARTTRSFSTLPGTASRRVRQATC